MAAASSTHATMRRRSALAASTVTAGAAAAAASVGAASSPAPGGGGGHAAGGEGAAPAPAVNSTRPATRGRSAVATATAAAATTRTTSAAGSTLPSMHDRSAAAAATATAATPGASALSPPAPCAGGGSAAAGSVRGATSAAAGSTRHTTRGRSAAAASAAAAAAATAAAAPAATTPPSATSAGRPNRRRGGARMPATAAAAAPPQPSPRLPPPSPSPAPLTVSRSASRPSVSDSMPAATSTTVAAAEEMGGGNDIRVGPLAPPSVTASMAAAVGATAATTAPAAVASPGGRPDEADDESREPTAAGVVLPRLPDDVWRVILAELPVLDTIRVVQTCRRFRRLLGREVYAWIFQSVLAAERVAGTTGYQAFGIRVSAAVAEQEGRHLVAVVRGAAHAGKSLANFNVPAEMRAILARETLPLMWPKVRMVSRSLAKKHFKVPSNSPAWNIVSPSRSYYNYAGHFGSSFRAYYSLQSVFKASFVANRSLGPVAALYAKRSLVASRKASRVAANAAGFRALLAAHATSMDQVAYAIPLLPSFTRYVQGVASVQQAMLKKTLKALLSLHKALDPAALEALRSDPVARAECEPLFHELIVDYSAAVEVGPVAARSAVAAIASAVKATLWRYFGPQCEECLRAAAARGSTDVTDAEDRREEGCEIGRGVSVADTVLHSVGGGGRGGRRFFDDRDLAGHMDVEHRRPERAARNVAALASETAKRQLGRDGLGLVAGLNHAFVEFSLDRLVELRTLLGADAEQQVVALWRDCTVRTTVVATVRGCILPGPSRTNPLAAARELLRLCRKLARYGAGADHTAGPFVDSFHCYACSVYWSSVAQCRRHVLHEHSEDAARALLPAPQFFCSQCPPAGEGSGRSRVGSGGGGGSGSAGDGADGGGGGLDEPAAFESVRDLNLHYLAVHRTDREVGLDTTEDCLDALLRRREAQLDAAAAPSAAAAVGDGGDSGGGVAAAEPPEASVSLPSPPPPTPPNADVAPPPPPRGFRRSSPSATATTSAAIADVDANADANAGIDTNADGADALPSRREAVAAAATGVHPAGVALATAAGAAAATAAVAAAATAVRGAAAAAAAAGVPLPLPSPRGSPAGDWIDPFPDGDSVDGDPYGSQGWMFDSPASSWQMGSSGSSHEPPGMW
ncbi:hypothetical protein MMPV_000344 [Pyropia vietnamensis]